MSSLRITLRAGERIFLNGAVLKVERKTTLEFMNDVTFLLESHVMQVEDAKTPMRQLYFIVQMMLMDPADLERVNAQFQASHRAMMQIYTNRNTLDGLNDVAELVAGDRPFDALKRIRAMIPMDDMDSSGPYVTLARLAHAKRPSVAHGANPGGTTNPGGTVVHPARFAVGGGQ